MGYIINKYNGEQAAVVEDGTINTTLDLKLIGKNYAGYGEAQNENYVWLLENFAGQTEPPKAINGQLWYNISVNKLQISNGLGTWRSLGIIDSVSTSTLTSKVANLSVGDFYWNTSTEQLWCKSTTENVLIGGKLTGISTSMKASTVTATDNIQRNIIEACVTNTANTTITSFVISGESDMFTLHSGEALLSEGFLDIHPGITIKNIDSATTVSSSEYKFWGTASNSDKLAGANASEYVNQTLPSFQNIVKFSDNGLAIGTTTQRLYITVDDTTYIPIIHNRYNDTITFKTTVSTLPKIAMQLVGEDIVPGNPAVSNIGTPVSKFDTVYATTFDGNATSATGLDLNGDVKVPSEATLADTIVVRTSTTETFDGVSCDPGSIRAAYFMGQGFITGGPGDLAERYLADSNYEVGTVVMIGGTAEITAAQPTFRACGVVSGAPTIIMNNELVGGTIVALKGRVPVKVIGQVNKGDRLISAENGAARAYTTTDDSGLVFAIALETNQFNEVTLVEALVL